MKIKDFMLLNMKYKNIFNPLNSFLFLTSVFLLTYTGYRAYTLSFTHDESYTFIHYVNSSFIDILTYNLNPIIANSHPLNTLSMKWLGGLFGNYEFVLRLHSFLAHFVYLIFTYLILKESNSKFLLFFGFIILNCNPYLLDFFSLARGYGLSISLMTVSIYYFIKYTKYQRNTFMNISLLISVLAVLANFSLISFSCALILVYEWFFILSRTTLQSILIKNISIAISLLILFFIYNGPIRVLIDHNELNFGGTSGLWFDTAISSIVCYLYASPYFDSLIFFLRFMIVFVFLSTMIILFIQYKAKMLTDFSYITIILFLILVASTLQHIFLKGSFFRERFALFLVPLFFFALLNVISFMIQRKKSIKISGYALSVLTILCALSICFSSLNMTHCYAWKYDADDKEILSEINDQRREKSNITVGNTWIFEPAINFYRETKHLNWLAPANRDGLRGDYDFYIVEWNDLNSFDKSNKNLIKTYPVSGTTLFKKIN